MGARQFLKRALTGALANKQKVVIPALQGSLLDGRKALVTGGTSGIGYAIAEAFIANGASVCITGRDFARIDAAVARLARNASGTVLDSSDIGSFDCGFDEVEQLLGGECDLLVNNAGVLSGGPFSSVTPKDWDRCMDVNLRGSYFLAQEFARRLIGKNTTGAPSHKIGNILNVASSSSMRPALSPYTVSKWGLRGLTLGLAKALVPQGIVVNGVAPGPTATPMLVGDEGSPNLDLPSSPIGRYAAAEEIANMAVVLASSMGDSVVGDIVFMTGGAGLITLDDMKYEF